MKKILLALMIGVCGFLASMAQDSCSQLLPCQPVLRQAYERISALDGFVQLSQKEVPKALGRCSCTVHGNSSHRDEVLGILSALPDSALYSEEVTAGGKVSRYYITTDAIGQSCMLYAFVGFGGNDLMVLLFEGGDLAKYREEADKIKPQP